MSEQPNESQKQEEVSPVMASELLRDKKIDPKELDDLGANFAHSDKEWQE